MPERTNVILCEGRDAASTSSALGRELFAALRSRPAVQLAVLPHLYDLDGDGPGMRHLRSLQGDMIVLAGLYPRAAYWVLDANDVKGRMGRSVFVPEEEVEVSSADDSEEKPDRTIWCLDLRGHAEAGPLLAEIDRIVAESTGQPAVTGAGAEASSNGETHIDELTQRRWYPVIDADRCTNCLECLNFCLFGVFEVDEAGGLIIVEPDACRAGCPACARVCPSQAIMFPQYDNPAVAGKPGSSPGDFNLDLVQLLGSIDPKQLAAAEREQCVTGKAELEEAAEKDDLDRLVDDLDRMDL